jgi:hypothetical protein
MADTVVRRLRKRSSSITDDLAILVVKYEPIPVRRAALPANVRTALTGGEAGPRLQS